jgi:hypothetical protein
MARSRIRKRHKEEMKPLRNGLEPPHGQPGKNPYVIYADYRRDDMEFPKVLILNFAAKYAAKFFLDKLIAGDTWEECDPVGNRRGIHTATGIRITMFDDELWGLLDYEPTELEAEWADDQVERDVQRFKYGRAEVRDGDPDVSRTEWGNDQDPPKGRRNKSKREPKPERPKIDKTGLVSANDIAKELEVEGREVRQVLRALKLEKPAGGWLFDKKTAEEIRTKVKKGLKAKKS